MKSIQNYKNIRRKAKIIGLSPMYFIIFFSLTALSVMLLIAGVSLAKIIGIAIFVGLNYVSCYFLSQNNLMRNFFNKKFPSEVSNLTENQN